MKIRTQLITSIVFFSIALLIIAASVVTTNEKVAQLNAHEELANSIELKANELGYLSNDFLLYQESQQVDRWESKYASINDDLANLTVDASDQQVLVNNIIASQQRLKEVFADILTHTASVSLAQQNTLDPAFIQVSSSRIGVQTQGMVFDASRLSQKISEEQDQQKMVNYLLIIALLGTFGAFILTSYFLIYRRTLNSIAGLQAGTQIIGSGNLDHVIETNKNDEFGELAGAFNRMSTNLKMVMASKADLEREVAERTKAEEALRKSEAQLLIANESLQTKQTELQVQAEEMEIQLEELRATNDELEKVTNALRESEERYRTIVETAAEGIWISDTDGRTTFVNKRMAEMIGYDPEDMIGKMAYDFMDEKTRADVRQSLEQRRQGLKDNFERKLICRDGSTVWALVSATPLKDKDGQIIALMGMLTDITERKRAEKDLLEAKMQAELYLDLMGHDINNMHQIAIGYLELALDALDLDKIERELIIRPLETMQRSAKLIDNVRKLQRVQAREIKEDVVDLDDILDRVVGEYREIAGQKIVCNNGSGSHKVMANELLYDVFANLVGNAVKHTGGNGTDIVVGVGIASDGTKKYYQVSVEDNGPGIPDELKDKVFNRLQRGETRARGVGLGLYLVKSLVESYHGRVWVEDRVRGDYSKGSRFVVMLPAIDN
jgi:PAS domain S-box-containing protein